MYKNMSTKRKAVSPVIATVILIAVAVALGIAVAFWASGLTSSFSKYEKLGVSTQYSQLVTTGSLKVGTGTVTCKTTAPCWIIHLGGQNTGSSSATIEQIQVNSQPVNSTSFNIPVASGDTFSFVLYLISGNANAGNGQTFASGQTVQVTLITAAGNNYPASIVLQ